MGRMLPIYCERCGLVEDWGDFGPESPSGAGVCRCPTSGVRTHAALTRLGLHDLRPYDDPERGHVDPLDDPDTRAAVRDLVRRLLVDPHDPYGETTP